MPPFRFAATFVPWKNATLCLHQKIHLNGMDRTVSVTKTSLNITSNLFKPCLSYRIFLGVSGVIGIFRNVFVLYGEETRVRCINCSEIVGTFDVKSKVVKLTEVKIKKIMPSEFRVCCVQVRRGGVHSHRYRYWQAVADCRKLVVERRSHINSRGIPMKKPCKEGRIGCLFEIVDESCVNQVGVLFYFLISVYIVH